MRPTFLLNTDLQLVSALVTKGVEDGLKLHTSIELVGEYTTEYGKIDAGSRGFVDYIDPENGTVEILMEGIQPAVLAWGNMLILVPFDTDDVLPCLRVVFPKRTTPTQDNITALFENVSAKAGNSC